MIRCTECLMPDTRPDTPFVNGVCGACINAKARPQIDWEARKKSLLELLDRHDGRCIVPSSGGKDSHFQVLTLLDLGADVTVVTATTCHLTELGRRNIDNLARFANTIQYSPNKSVRAKLNRLGLELVGDISWPEHVSIFTTPFRAAYELGIPLIFYGENPQNHYGGPMDTPEAMTMTRRWVAEFGGFLGLRANDLIGQYGLSERDLAPYMPPDLSRMDGIEAHFLGQYVPWDSRHNGEYAWQYGMNRSIPCHANWLDSENLDNAQTGLHDYFGFLKYGYGRGCAQISMDIRAGRISREEAWFWLIEHDGIVPGRYAGVEMLEVLRQINPDEKDHIRWIMDIADQFANPDLFETGDGWPRLKEWGC